MSARIYLDNAATSWPKPEAVYQAVDRALRELGAPAGRSVYREALEVQTAIQAVRTGVANLVGLAEPRQVIFTANGTDALNLAIHGLVRPGDHVVTTAAEHNSVLRPLRFLEDRYSVSVTHVPCDQAGVGAADQIAAALRPDTRLVAMLHASNVTGGLQPVEAVGKLLRGHPAFFLIDAAQSLGHVETTFDRLGCDLLAAPGHKGLLGPLGTGILAIRPGVERELVPLRQGGTGSESENDRQPETLPEKYESGNLNVPGLCGLAAGIAYLQQRGLAEIRRHELELTRQLLAGLSEISGVRLVGPPAAEERVGVVSLQVEGYDPQEVATLLDAAHGVQVRAGLHCAPRIHQALGTFNQGGTVRISFGPFTTEDDLRIVCAALGELAGASFTS